MVLHGAVKWLSPLTPKHELRKLQRQANSRLLKLRSGVVSVGPATASENDEKLAFVVVESMNIWASFVRSYYLSWFIPAKTITGKQITSVQKFTSFVDAIVFAIRRLRRPSYRGTPARRDEPPWHEPRTLLTLAADLRVSNLGQIQAAFSINASFVENLPTVRNFYAHRNQETFQRVQRRGTLLGLGLLRPCELLSTPLPRRPQNILTDWLDEIRITIELLCQ